MYAISRGGKRDMKPLYANVNLCRLYIRPSGQLVQGRHTIPNFNRRQERDRRRRVLVGPVPSHDVVEDATNVNAQARMRACLLRLHLLSGAKALQQVLQGNVIKR